MKLLLLLLLLSGTTFASTHNASILQEKCVNAAKSVEEISHLSPSEKADVAFCEGYVSATMDTLAAFLFKSNNQQCMSVPDKPVKEIVVVVMEYLKRHPDRMSEPGTKAVVTAVGQAFNCS
jgi:hypothetical protein